MENASRAFIEGARVALDPSNDGIVLPSQMQFVEGRKDEYTYDIPELNRKVQFSVWNPPSERELKIIELHDVPNVSRVVTFHVALTPQGGNMHVHSISFKE
jgi:hypothetical protein